MAYLLPSVLLSSVPFFTEGDSVHVHARRHAVRFRGGGHSFHLRHLRHHRPAIALRFENMGLIEELRNQKLVAEQAREAAEEANVAKSRFSGCSRSRPCGSRCMRWAFLSMRCKKQSLPADGRAVVGNIRRSVDAMEDLFNSLLDVSRLDAGIVRPRIATIPLRH